MVAQLCGIYLLSESCQCLRDSYPCILRLADKNDLKAILIGGRLHTRAIQPFRDTETTWNLTGIIKLITTNEMTNHIAFCPPEIENKCILITGHEGHVYCIENKIRFELD